MVVITRQTRRPARRADENAPPTNINGAPATRSRAADTSLTAKSASTVSSLPVMKRQSSSSAVPTNGKVLPLAKRSAFGDVTHISKNVETNGLKKDRKPLVSTRSSLQAPQRTRVSVISEVVLKKEGKAAPRRKVATSVKPISSSAPLTEKPLNVQGEREAEPARKRRKTSTPPPITDEESSEDEVPYTEDGREVFPGKIYHGGLKSPKRKSFAKDMGWTDLDAEDDGDPMMASEYVIDAFNYMLEVEVSRTFRLCCRN